MARIGDGEAGEEMARTDGRRRAGVAGEEMARPAKWRHASGAGGGVAGAPFFPDRRWRGVAGDREEVPRRRRGAASTESRSSPEHGRAAASRRAAQL